MQDSKIGLQADGSLNPRNLRAERNKCGALHCAGHWNAAIATQAIGLVPFQARGVLLVAEEQSRTRGGQAAALRINLNSRAVT
jgi:hypothetical protein